MTLLNPAVAGMWLQYPQADAQLDVEDVQIVAEVEHVTSPLAVIGSTEEKLLAVVAFVIDAFAFEPSSALILPALVVVKP